MFGLFDNITRVWHQTSSEWVFMTEETGAGRKVWFQEARIETHEDTGEKRVRFGRTLGPKFFDDTMWNLATALTDRQSTYSTVLMRDEYKPTFPKEEFREENSTVA